MCHRLKIGTLVQAIVLQGVAAWSEIAGLAWVAALHTPLPALSAKKALLGAENWHKGQPRGLKTAKKVKMNAVIRRLEAEAATRPKDSEKG